MKQRPLPVEVSAKNPDAAVAGGGAQLGSMRTETDIEVLQVNLPGFRDMFGCHSARVRVKLQDRGIIARRFAIQLLPLCHLDIEVEPLSSAELVELILKEQDPDCQIGRHGKTLDARQALVGSMTDRLPPVRSKLLLHVDGNRLHRRDLSNRLPRRLSHRVRCSGKSASTPPLVFSENRILHELFKRELDPESCSKNCENDRKTVILQKRS